MIHLIPTPKKISVYEGFLREKAVYTESKITDDRLKKGIEKIPQSSSGVLLRIHITGNGDSERYSLEINDDKVVIKADTAKGAFWGIQTLRQLFEHDSVPNLVIEDEPDFQERGFYHDVSRGKIPTVKTLKQLIDQMAYYKLNSFQLYVEHTFEFEEYADSLERTGYLSADELRELDDYCFENFIDFVPSLSCFGHLFELLQKEKYKELNEIEDFESEQIFWYDRMRHHTIDPTNPKSLELIKSMIDRYMSCFSSEKFNICCDETFDLKIGKHWNHDTGRLYVDFVKKLIEYVKSKGKKVMMWADIILRHRELIDELPNDVEYLNWWYETEVYEENIELFNKLGKTQIVCPGTNSWHGFSELAEKEEINISKMTELGKKHGATGVLNTNWGDFGNPCSIELAMYGLVFGAEKSWNVATKADASFHNNVDFLLYKKIGAYEYLRRLSNVQAQISWMDFIRSYSNLQFPKKMEVTLPSEKTVIDAQETCVDLKEILEREEWKCDEFRREMLCSAEAVLVLTELFAKIAGYSIERKSDTSQWLKKYRQIWIEKNKESELREIERLFEFMEQVEM